MGRLAVSRTFVESSGLKKKLDELISNRRLLREDFDNLLSELLKNPDSGVLIPGLGGLRKIRLKSLSGGKSGGFRVAFLDLSEISHTHLLVLYPKNERSDLSPLEKPIIRSHVELLKREVKNVRNF